MFDVYRPGLALLTDLYQLTMANGYLKLGRGDQEAVFHLFFRKPPFAGGYAVAAGLEPVLEFLQGFRFEESDLAYLGGLTGNDGERLFEPGFLEELRKFRLTVDVDAVPEGTVVFGQEPLLRVQGPILQCQLLETPLLNLINFQTLIATKASRICAAAGDDPVLEFGLRRAQGIDGALSASRAAYLGGCSATSNVLAGKLFGIPVKGTHAHSWVMSFESEAESFAGYADAMPNNCVFLVDTYGTLEGVRRAVAVGRTLRERGHEMVGIRLDSGDLAYLSIAARRLLDEAGFPETVIVASNDLDEHIIENLKSQGAQIAVWGVGTKLATAYDQPALGGVYKLGALREGGGDWQPKLKLSEQAIKTSIPGILQVRRYEGEDGLLGDMIYDVTRGIAEPQAIVDTGDPTRRKELKLAARSYDLLIPAIRGGQRVAERESLETIRQRRHDNLDRLHSTSRRLMNPHTYSVGLESSLHDFRNQLIEQERNLQREDRQ